MSRFPSSAAFSIALACASGTVAAQESPPAAAEPVIEPAPEPATEPPAAPVAAETPALPAWLSGLTVSGLVDTYVAVRFGADEFRAPTPLRAFDAGNGSFTLAYAELAVALAPEPAGLRVDLGFGPTADLINVDGDVGHEVFKHLEQAYVSLKLPTKRSMIVDAGRFVTMHGFEVIEAKDNWNYTRSILFTWAIPFAHTGVRLTAAASDKLTLGLHVVNAWDVSVDNNDGKTFGAQATYKPGVTTVTINAMAGPEATDDDGNWRELLDLVVLHPIGSKLQLGFNADVGHEARDAEPNATWWGVAGMAQYAAASKLLLAFRGEYFSDPDGARIGVADLGMGEVTGTARILVGGNAEVRVELRGDFASQDILGDGTDGSQVTATAAALAWF